MGRLKARLLVLKFINLTNEIMSRELPQKMQPTKPPLLTCSINKLKGETPYFPFLEYITLIHFRLGGLEAMLLKEITPTRIDEVRQIYHPDNFQDENDKRRAELIQKLLKESNSEAVQTVVRKALREKIMSELNPLRLKTPLLRRGLYSKIDDLESHQFAMRQFELLELEGHLSAPSEHILNNTLREIEFICALDKEIQATKAAINKESPTASIACNNESLTISFSNQRHAFGFAKKYYCLDPYKKTFIICGKEVKIFTGGLFSVYDIDKRQILYKGPHQELILKLATDFNLNLLQLSTEKYIFAIPDEPIHHADFSKNLSEDMVILSKNPYNNNLEMHFDSGAKAKAFFSIFKDLLYLELSDSYNAVSIPEDSCFTKTYKRNSGFEIKHKEGNHQLFELFRKYFHSFFVRDIIGFEFSAGNFAFSERVDFALLENILEARKASSMHAEAITQDNILEQFKEHGNNPIFDNGDTLLHYATRYKPECIKGLVNAGADIKKKNSEGQTPLDLADEEHQDIMRTAFRRRNIFFSMAKPLFEQGQKLETGKVVNPSSSKLNRDDHHSSQFKS